MSLHTHWCRITTPPTPPLCARTSETDFYRTLKSTTAAICEYLLTVKDDPVASWRFKCHLILLYSVSPHSPRQHPGHNVWFVSVSPTPTIRNVSTAQFILLCCTLCTFTSHTPESHFPVFEAVFVLVDPPRWWINSLPSLPWVRRPCLDDILCFFICVCIVFTFASVWTHVPICCVHVCSSGTAERLWKCTFPTLCTKDAQIHCSHLESSCKELLSE